MARTLGCCLVIWTALVVLAGCQRGQAALIPVSGRVFYKQVLLQGGTIVFTPDPSRGENGPVALGKINTDGSYHLFTGDLVGAPAGHYRVTVNWLAPSGVQPPGQLVNTPYSYLPDKYRDPQLSELACEVKAAKPNAIDFNLD